MPFEKRHAGCEEREKINRRRIYDTLRINFFEATKQTACIFSKGEETGVNYYGARYLDPKYSRWLSGDPALGDCIPKAPIDDEAKKHNENLPGMGGVFNVVNLHLYHYAGNNPVKYTDPDGRANTLTIASSDIQAFADSIKQTLSSIPSPLIAGTLIVGGFIAMDNYYDGAISEGIADGATVIANKTIEAGTWIGDTLKNA